MKRTIASVSIRMTTDDTWVFEEQVVFQESPWPERGFIRTAAIRRQEWEDLGSPDAVEVTVTAAEPA